MNEIKNLIEMIKRKEPKANAAILRLVAIGMPSVPAVIAEIRRSSLDSIRVFKKVILQIRDTEITPVLVELLDDENIHLRITAFEALGQSKDERALQPLIDQLLASRNTEFSKSLAARALGELGDSRAIEGLRKVVKEVIGEPNNQQAIENFIKLTKEEANDDMFHLILDVAIALSKLGSQEMGNFVICLSKYDSNEEDAEEKEIIRADAVRALRYVVTPGMFDVLRKALHDSSPEVRDAALDPIFYLGIKDAISELILCVEDKYADISGIVFTKIHDLTGEWPNNKILVENVRIKELEEWWGQIQIRFKSGVCYRLGKPIWLPNIIALLKEPNQRRTIIEELCIITGKNFGYNPHISAEVQDDVFDRALKWWDEEGHRFEVGCLYKYGHKQSIQDIFQ